MIPSSPDYRGHLTETELWAAALDGDVVRIGDAFQCVDLPIDAEFRAASLRSELSPEHIAVERTASWIWGGALRLTRPYEVATPRPSALVSQHPERFDIRPLRPADGDVIQLSDIYVTTRLRTIIDLLRSPRPDYDGAAVGRIMEEGRITLDAVKRDLSRRRRLSGRDLAWTRLQVLVTR